jgi:prepilin-type N-terminal cleavage/methylation domain-containing protein
MTRTQGEQGFTLVELLVAITIMSMIMGGISESIIVGLRTTAAISTSVAESHDTQMMTAWFPRDVNGATSIWGGAPLAGTKPVCTPPVGTTRTVLTMLSGDPTLPLLTSYVVVKTGTLFQLVRTVCQGANVPQGPVIVVHNLAAELPLAVPAVPSATATCPPTACPPAAKPAPASQPDTVTLTVTELSGFTFQVTGQSRVNASLP